MSSTVPTISVTQEKDSSGDSASSDNEDSFGVDCNSNYGGVTDVEDFDSQIDSNRSRRASPYSLGVPKKQKQPENDATDVEDYNDDSDSEDEDKSKCYPELMLSLQEFLQQGLQEQAIVNNDGEAKIEMKAGNFLQAQDLNTLPDYLTDCEDYNTDSEIEYEAEKSVCFDLDAAVGNEQAQVCIADSERPLKDEHDDDSDQYEDVSVISDISDLASALSDVTGAGIRGMSEDEMLEMSGNEEECQIVYSGSSSDEGSHSNIHSYDDRHSYEINVAFISASGQQCKTSAKSGKTFPLLDSKKPTQSSNLLNVSRRNEEVLTDTERIDDSQAEDDDDSFDNDDEANNEPIPRAVILAPGDDGACQTDIEDMLYDDSSLIPINSLADVLTVALESLPPPHREVVELKEDKFGDTITNVMPMNDEFQFGIHVSKDEDPTDTEDYSCNENDCDKSFPLPDTEAVASQALSAHQANGLIESEFTVENESMKSGQSKRLELHTNTESVTDVEEIYVAGTNRRKKPKTKTASKTGTKPKFLDVSKGANDDGGTDIEDIDLSDCTSTQNNRKAANEAAATASTAAAANISDKVTDVEDISADDATDLSEHETPLPPVSNDSLSDYHSSSANVVISMETDAKLARKCPRHQHKTKNAATSMKNSAIHCHPDDAFNQSNTDVEEVQLPSDAEDQMEQLPDTCTNCAALNDMLNESYTVVHDKSVRNFDENKLHVKGPEVRDAHTDVEYVESDEPANKDGN